MANPVTHLEKTIAGEVQPVTHLEKVIAEYGGGDVYENLEAGTNILIEETADGKAKISASGEVSSEDTVARAEIAAIKDGTNIDSFGDVETALATKANTATTYTKTEVDTALGSKQDTISDLSTIRSGAALGATAVQPETGKGLSTNDYTTAEKTKLAGIEAQANKTTVDDALSGSSTNPVQNKVVKSALDSKANASTTYTKNEVDTALSGKQATLTTAQLAAANSGIDSTKVAQIETNKNNISINSIKSSITMEQGYTLVTQSTLYQQGKHIFGNLIIKKDSGNFSDTSETVCTLGKPPAITGMLFCGFGVSEWGIESIGYAFLGSNGGVSVKDTKTTNTTVNIAVDYVIS